VPTSGSILSNDITLNSQKVVYIHQFKVMASNDKNSANTTEKKQIKKFRFAKFIIAEFVIKKFLIEKFFMANLAITNVLIS